MKLFCFQGPTVRTGARVLIDITAADAGSKYPPKSVNMQKWL
jgi:hypothetical protein